MYAPLQTRNGSGISPNFRGLGLLGNANATLTPDAAMQQAIQAYSGDKLNPKQFQNSSWLSQAASCIQSASIGVSGGFGPDCGGQTAQPMNLLSTASGLALTTATTATSILASSSVALIPAAAVPVVGWIAAGVGAIVGMISSIFRHHAQAVQRDLAFGCSVIPAVNNAFAVIAKAVQAGQMNPSDAAAALPQIYSEYMSAGGASGSVSGGPSGIQSGGQPINDSPWCNSNCELSVVVLGMVIYWQAQYTSMAEQAAASATAQTSAPTVSQGGSQVQAVAAGSAASASGLSAIPVWAWALGAGAILWGLS